MATKKLPPRRTFQVQRRSKLTVDPSRMALQAFERIKGALIRSGHANRIGEPVPMRELAARASVVGQQLPASYVATMRVASTLGDPEDFLDAGRMAETTAEIHLAGPQATRYVAFALVDGRPVCFDKKTQLPDGEMAISLWGRGSANPLSRSFGEWLDAVADEREERIQNAADIPARLRTLLTELGFEFRYPVVGRLPTGDILAIEMLIGSERAQQIRGETGRLFDSTGKALLTLNLDDFSMSARVRNTVVELQAEDVFRWLRGFRDENFFGDTNGVPPSHPDAVRDLRRAPREAPYIVRSVVELGAGLAAKSHAFVCATGRKAEDYYLLGRAPGKRESLILRFEDDIVTAARALEEELEQIHVTGAGALWGLSATHAFRIDGPHLEKFPLARPTRGPIAWKGIGGTGDRVLVWGAGALLQFDGSGFAPFPVDLGLDPAETVLSVRALGDELSALVCREGMGAVARFDGRVWLPVDEGQVIEGDLVGLDVSHGVDHVLDVPGNVYTVSASRPTRLSWDPRHRAFKNESGEERTRRGMLVQGSTVVLAVDGGFVMVPAGGDPTLYQVAPSTLRGHPRLDRIGTPTATKLRGKFTSADDDALAIVACAGACAWVLRGEAFHAIDLRSF